MDTKIHALHVQVEDINFKINTLLSSGQHSSSTGAPSHAMQQLQHQHHMMQQQLVSQLQWMVGNLHQQQAEEPQVEGPIHAWGGKPMQGQPHHNEKGGWQTAAWQQGGGRRGDGRRKVMEETRRGGGRTNGGKANKKA